MKYADKYTKQSELYKRLSIQILNHNELNHA